MSEHQPLTFLVIMAATHGLYGESFLKELKSQGHRVVVVTRAEALNEYDWPRQWIDSLYAVRDIFDRTELRNAVSYLAREIHFDRLIGTGEYDIEISAELREHLRIPGMGESTARYFRDKLAMRDRAFRRGLRVPAFVPAIHRPAIARFLNEVPSPWVLKPRWGASSKGVQVLKTVDAVWQAIDALGDKAADHLIERFVAGDVYHVDGVSWDTEVQFAIPHRYGKPILDLHTNGGVYTTRRVPKGSREDRELLALNREVIKALGLQDGVFHVEYIQSRETGEFYFLEAGARVGAGLIEEMVEAESGINLWAEWARLEVAQIYPPYRLTQTRDTYAGVLATVASRENPDPSRYLGSGVHSVQPKPYHLGLLVTGDDPEWVDQRLNELARQVGQDIMVHI